MKIKSLEINGIGGIRHLNLQFIDKMNIICGANGIGKTTILDIISDAFSSNTQSKLKRNALSDIGKYKIEIVVNENENEISLNKEIKIREFKPDSGEYYSALHEYSRDIMYFGVERNLKYIKLNSISSDPKRQNYIMEQMVISGIQGDDIKNWFVNRYLFVDKPGSLYPEQIVNYNLAKSIFSVLDDSIKFKTVLANSFDIILNSDKGDIYFEYLSSGYKSCIYIIFGIIKEIEYRTADKPIEAQAFKGVILIDEIDLHLHPIWQAELVKALKHTFPHAQFIVTTHSPSVLQTLDAREIIALGATNDGNTVAKDLNLGRYGLQGWTLEEILKYVMEMPTTTSQLYKETLKNFDDAMNKEDREAILKQYDLLKEMLHINNPLRKLLSIQVAEWEE